MVKTINKLAADPDLKKIVHCKKMAMLGRFWKPGINSALPKLMRVFEKLLI